MFLHEFLLPPNRDLAAPAIIGAGGGTTHAFADIDRLAHDIEEELVALGVTAGDRVLLRMRPSPSALAAILACSRMHAPFVPVDPGAPAGREKQIVQLARPAVRIDDVGGTSTVASDEGVLRYSPISWGGETRFNSRGAVGTGTVYIIFTSGTTGAPKGIAMSHGAVVAFWKGMIESISPDAEFILGTTAPLHFDMSLLDLGLAWGTGNPLAQIDRELLISPRHFVRQVQDRHVTHFSCVPSVWRILLRNASNELRGLTSLRSTLFAGEAFPVGDVEELRSLLPGLQLINCFGQSESIACSFMEVPTDLAGSPSLPIGPAHPGAEMILVDSHGQVVTVPGETGEIYLRGPTLFSGYWGDDRATKTALVRNPVRPDDPELVFRTGDLAALGRSGQFYFLGRSDHQVKIRGNRVELEEVERSLERHPAVNEAGVLVTRTNGADRLEAFVSVAEAKLDATELTAFCALSLPDYMIPSQVSHVDALPRNTAGKLDRVTLARLAEQRGTTT